MFSVKRRFFTIFTIFISIQPKFIKLILKLSSFNLTPVFEITKLPYIINFDLTQYFMVTLSQILSFSGYVFYDRIDGKNRKVPGSAEIQWGEVYCQIHAIFFLSIICTIIDAILVEICRSRFRASETITASNGRHTQCNNNSNRQKILAL